MNEKHCTPSDYIIHIALAVVISIIGTLLYNAATRVPEHNMKQAMAEASMVGLFHGVVMSALICTGVLS